MIYSCPICKKFVYDIQNHYELKHPSKFACDTCEIHFDTIENYKKHISDEYHYNAFYHMSENNRRYINMFSLINDLKKIPKDISNLILTYVPARFCDNNVTHKNIVIINSI